MLDFKASISDWLTTRSSACVYRWISHEVNATVVATMHLVGIWLAASKDKELTYTIICVCMYDIRIYLLNEQEKWVMS